MNEPQIKHSPDCDIFDRSLPDGIIKPCNCHRSPFWNEMIDIGRIQYLEHIAETASDLEHWLGRNVGDSADWPIRITGDQEGADKLCALLTDLKHALMPYRRSSGKLTLRAPLIPEEVNPDEL